MAQTSSPVVYLDTQDYSRFGRVLEGKGKPADEELYLRLLRMAEEGAARFACSMPIMGELLRYDGTLPHVTECKARAMEALCRGWSLPYPAYVIAMEVGGLAAHEGLIDRPPSFVMANDQYQWFPDIDESLEDMRKRLLNEVTEEIVRRAPNRSARRKLSKKARTIDVGAAVAAAAPEITRKYGLPEEAVTASLGKFFRKQISSAEASRRLFSAIARPTTFVRAYFVGYEGEKTLPEWMSGFGRDIARGLATFRTQIELAPARTPDQRRLLQNVIDQKVPDFSASFLNLADQDVHLAGVSRQILAQLRTDPAMVQKVETARLIGLMVGAYISQVVGLMGSTAKIEPSFGGDLIHSIYIPHVDIWRGDKRFGSLAARTLPKYADRLVTDRQALPDAIEAWHSRTASEVAFR